MIKTLCYLTVFFMFIGTVQAKFSKQLVKDNLGIVWGMESLDSGILFTERSGKLKFLNLKAKTVKEISGAPKVYSRGQGGLLDIKKHPDFKQNKRIYLSYSKEFNGQKTTALGYGLYQNGKLEKFKDIFIAKGEASKRIHFGSRIVFKNNIIYLSIGERGVRDNAQDLSNHFGTIVRLTDEGKALEDNPFYGKKKALPEIWSYGHRNPQGLAYDKKNDTLYAMEHGPRGGDEINIIEPGKNYGWPIISYGKEYVLPMMVGESTHKKGMEQPLKYYVPSIAPCDLVYYDHEKFPELKGSLISGALKLTHVNVYHVKSKKEKRLFDKENMRVRSILNTPNGEIYFGTDGGKIFQLVKK